MVSSDMRGIEIFNFKNKKIGSVLYPLWTCKSTQIDGFVFLKSSFVQLKSFVPFSSVDRFENGCIYLIKNYKTRKNNLEVPHGRAKLGERSVFVSKYTFDEKTGSVKSVEIAKSIYEDIQSKRKQYTDFTARNGLVIIK